MVSMRAVVGCGATGALLMLLAGCSHHDSAAPSPAAQSAAHRTLTPAETLSRSLVAAVPVARPAGGAFPVQLRFGLQSRPELNQPLQVKLAIIPGSAPFDRVAGKVEAEEGLEVQGSGELPQAGKPADGQPIVQTLSVVPRRDGLFILTVTLSVDAAGQLSTQSYSIPVIAGQGMPEVAAKLPAGAPAPTTSH